MEAEASRSVATVAQVSVHLVLSSAGFGRTFFFCSYCFTSLVSLGSGEQRFRLAPRRFGPLGRSKLAVFIGLSSVSVAVETPMWFHFGSLAKWSRSVEPDEPGISNLTGAAKARLAC